MKALVITQKVDENDAVLGFFSGWLDKLAKRIDNLYVFALEKKDANLAENIELYSLDRRNGNRLRDFLKFNRILMNIFLNKKIDIIFIHMCPMYAILAAPYAKLFNIPLVLWYAHKEAGLKLRLAHFLSDRVLTPSKESFRVKSAKTIVTGHGIDIEKFRNSGVRGQNNTKRIILSVGRLSPVKSYEALIETADILINQRNIKNLEFQIVGGTPIKSQGTYLDSLKDMVRKYRLEDYVQFIGPIPHTQIERYYQNCDLLVSASNSGSIDKAPLEAMASGKGVLTCNEAFKDMLNKYLQGQLIFEEGDAAQLSERIDSMLGMEEKSRDELGLDLRNTVSQNHNLDKLMDKFIVIFQGLVGDKRGIKK